MDRRTFLESLVAGGTALAARQTARAFDAPDLKPLYAEIEKRHDEAVARLREWIAQPSIAAEHRRHGGRL